MSRHVLIVPSWYPSCNTDPNGSFFREQALALRKRGFKVGVLYADLRSLKSALSRGFRKSELRVLDDCGISEFRSIGMNWFPRPVALRDALYSLHGTRLFKKYVAQHGMPDILHAHSIFYGGAIAYHISKKFNVPYVMTEHSTAFARGLISNKQYQLAGRIAEKSSRIFAVSQPFADSLNNIFSSRKWEVMPNVVHDEFFELKENAADRWHDVTFLNIAFMHKKKRQLDMIEAFARVQKIYPNVRLHIGGGGAEETRLRAYVEHEGLAESVTFLGMLSRKQVMQAMDNADIFVLPSEYETFGVVLIEAMAKGLPVIATRSGGPESIVIDEVGLLVDPCSVDQLANAMVFFMENRAKYNSENIRKICRDAYSESAVVAKLCDVYDAVLGRND